MSHGLNPELGIASSVRVEIDEYTAELPEQTVQALASIATKNGLDYGTAIVQAIANENFLEELEQYGYRLIIKQPRRFLRSGRMRYLVRT
jgi:hypothetical protein